MIRSSRLLPARDRQRWAEEWIGELAALTGRAHRLGFIIDNLRGLPRLGWTLRRPQSRLAAAAGARVDAVLSYESRTSAVIGSVCALMVAYLFVRGGLDMVVTNIESPAVLGGLLYTGAVFLRRRGISPTALSTKDSVLRSE